MWTDVFCPREISGPWGRSSPRARHKLPSIYIYIYKVERIYDAVEDIIPGHEKDNIHTVIMGNWNSVVGNGKVGKIVGPYGLGNQNYRGKKLKEICQRKVVTNTLFKQHK